MAKLTHIILACLLLGAFLVACRPSGQSPIPGGLISFTSKRGGTYEIYTMNNDGSKQTRLTKHAANDWHPAWSPDGTRIAFHSDRDGHFEIYVMEADGSGQRNLTNHPADDWYPSWSPVPDSL